MYVFVCNYIADKFSYWLLVFIMFVLVCCSVTRFTWSLKSTIPSLVFVTMLVMCSTMSSDYWRRIGIHSEMTCWKCWRRAGELKQCMQLYCLLYCVCIFGWLDVACYRSDFIYDLFEHMSLSTDQGQSTGFSRAQKKGAKKKATVSSQFKVHMSICKVVI